MIFDIYIYCFLFILIFWKDDDGWKWIRYLYIFFDISNLDKENFGWYGNYIIRWHNNGKEGNYIGQRFDIY